MRLKDGIHKDIGKFTYVDKDTFLTPFFTREYCDHFIGLFEDLGFEVDENGNYDTLIHRVAGGDQICADFNEIVENVIEPEILKAFTPADRDWET